MTPPSFAVKHLRHLPCGRRLARMADFDGEQGRENRQDFSHRGADGKSLLDEVLRRGRGECWGVSCRDGWARVG